MLCPMSTVGRTPHDIHSPASAYSRVNRAGWVYSAIRPHTPRSTDPTGRHEPPPRCRRTACGPLAVVTPHHRHARGTRPCHTPHNLPEASRTPTGRRRPTASGGGNHRHHGRRGTADTRSYRCVACLTPCLTGRPPATVDDGEAHPCLVMPGDRHGDDDAMPVGTSAGRRKATRATEAANRRASAGARNRRPEPLLHRLQNRHALHVMGHRKDVGLNESRKRPGQHLFHGSLPRVRAPRASRPTAHPSSSGGTGCQDQLSSTSPLPLIPDAGSHMMALTASPAAIMDSCPPAHGIPHPRRATSKARSPRTSRCTGKSSGDVCRSRWTSCTARPMGSWSCHCTWLGRE